MQQRMSAVTVPVITVIAVAVSIVTAFVGSGAVGGTPISQAASGAFSSDGTPLAPALSIAWGLAWIGVGRASGPGPVRS